MERWELTSLAARCSQAQSGSGQQSACKGRQGSLQGALLRCVCCPGNASSCSSHASPDAPPPPPPLNTRRAEQHSTAHRHWRPPAGCSRLGTMPGL